MNAVEISGVCDMIVADKEALVPFSPHTATIMSIVLPGEQIPAKHVNLKLGPGISQMANAIVSTKAGTLNHSANKARWWVESNSRRVRPLF